MKKMIIGIIIGGIIFGVIGVVASTMISSKNVTYQNKTVNSALDELYNEATTGKELVAAAITNKGITTTSSDTYETMANNINSIDNDHTKINQKINNLESKHNSDVTSLTGSISNLNQSLTDLRKNIIGEGVNLNSYSDTNRFVIPSDGYVSIQFPSSFGLYAATVGLYGADDARLNSFGTVTNANIIASNQNNTVFVKKGMKCAVLERSQKPTRYLKIKLV